MSGSERPSSSDSGLHLNGLAPLFCHFLRRNSNYGCISVRTLTKLRLIKFDGCHELHLHSFSSVVEDDAYAEPNKVGPRLAAATGSRLQNCMAAQSRYIRIIQLLSLKIVFNREEICFDNDNVDH